MSNIFESLVYENARGVKTVLSGEFLTDRWELRGRSGFSAPQVELITQKYVNGRQQIVGRIIQPRTVTFNMIVVGDSAQERDAIFFQMVDRLLDVGGGDIGKLYITRTDGKEVFLNCAYSSGLSIVEEYKKFHRFTLEFFAADPYFYSTYTDTQAVPVVESNVATLADDLYLGVWYLGVGDLVGQGVVINSSGGDIEPILRIKGRRMSITIRNEMTGKSISLEDTDLTNGDELVIDTRSQSRNAYIIREDGSIESAMQYIVWTELEIDFPLVPGNNLITWEGYGDYEPLYIDTTQQYLSA